MISSVSGWSCSTCGSRSAACRKARPSTSPVGAVSASRSARTAASSSALDDVREPNPGKLITLKVRTRDPNARLLLIAEVDDTDEELNRIAIDVPVAGAAPDPGWGDYVHYRADSTGDIHKYTRGLAAACLCLLPRTTLLPPLE